MIEVKNLNKSYGRKEILRNVNLKAECGEQVAIIGRNGCGKTTLLQALAGISSPNSGEIIYFGRKMMKGKAFTKYCGYLPQENALFPDLSVQDNICLWTGKLGKPDAKLIEMFDLSPILRSTVEKLSGGMKRRVSIACAMANWPPIILMDEPTTALDIYYQKEIHDLMKKYKEMNGILVVSTHHEKEILASDKVYLMEDGQLEELHGGDTYAEQL